MKKILLVSGHKSGHNSCKGTGVNEGDLNIELTKAVYQELKNYANVTMYPVERDMYKDNKNKCCQVDMSSFDYIFEIHFNGFNGSARGTNIQLHSDYSGGISVEQKIIDNVASFGFKKRGANGITRRDDLLNMSLALKLGVDYALLETCFYDNAEDMAIYKANKVKIAKAIANGIIDGFGLTASNSDKPSVSPTPPANTNTFKPYSVRVDIDNLNIRKGPGTNYAKTGKFTGKGVFTIVGESAGVGSESGWGKLKSGAGWISLDFATRV